MKELLMKYSNLIGVSGSEELISDEIRRDITEFDRKYNDSMGNLIIEKTGTSGKKIGIFAHMDEIGLMASYIDEKGFISFEGLGGWYFNTAVSQQVIFDNSIIGVIGGKPPHAMETAEREAGAKLKNMFIDVGASTKEEVIEMGIDIGSTAVFTSKAKSLANGLITGKALDNRVGVVAMIDVMNNVCTDNTVYGVGTTEEEVGLKGAKVISEKLNPDLAIIVDTCLSGDHPGFSWKEAGSAIGNVSITIADGAGRGILVPKKIINYVKRIAKENDIPVDFSVSNGGTTDGMATHGNGIPTIVVAVPTRYIHSPVEVLKIEDAENATKLIRALVEGWN